MLKSIEGKLGQLSKEELRTLNSMVIAMIKTKSKISSIRKSGSLNIGQVITLDHDRFRGQEFTITKIKRTKCLITGQGGSFNVPMSMVIS
tara:strand:+ start:192 stop:461 length:270 start_codon:yes stop_codon:yes gene_type:complete